MNRRSFIFTLGLGATISVFFTTCKTKINQWILRLVLPNRSLGHRLLTMDFPKTSGHKSEKLLIIGGGISGLSAAYYLMKKGFEDFKIIELESEPGGNSRYGKNEITTYPLGAHYLPLPNTDDNELISFLKDMNIITGTDDKGIPEIDDKFLSFSMQERLFIHNKWQDDIVPKYGLSAIDNDEIKRFYDQMHQLQEEKDARGNYYFFIPLSNSSPDEKYKIWDKWTMKEWLVEHNYLSKDLCEHIDYCCRDDYGLGINEVSAWAGVSYFAARKSKTWHKYHDSVISAPNGNGQLVDMLRKGVEDKIITKSIAYKIDQRHDKLEVSVYSEFDYKSYVYTCDKLILATPQFVTQRLIPERKALTNEFYYNPWVVATLTLNRNGCIGTENLAWDNVIHGGDGLGYIYAQHQELGKLEGDIVITYYYTLRDMPQTKRRKFVYDQPKEYWENIIISDLEKAHVDIRASIINIEINIWGHGMISPRPGFIFSEDIQKAKAPIENRIYFAHSDLTGISIFEEAFHQGIYAAKQILN